MKIQVWDENLDLTATKNLGYWERNMLALNFAEGWYYDKECNYIGWSRVLCLNKGSLNFHIPDDFDIGNLQEIERTYDGHTTKEKWQNIFNKFNIKE